MALLSEIRPLPIIEALKLYDILGKYIPSDMDHDETVIEFAGRIIDNVVEDRSTAIIDALVLMTKMSVSELGGFSSDYQLKLFADGLIINDVVSLKRFCEGIYYGR